MAIQIQTGDSGVSWRAVSELLKQTGLPFFEPDNHKKIFANSFAAAFAYDGDRLVGCGRLLSDGVCQAALYDLAVHPDYQGRQIGRGLVEALIAQARGCNVILYATCGKEPFYQKLGFRAMKTAMAKFVKADVMAQIGYTE